MPAAEVLIPAQFSAATHAGPMRAAAILRLDGETMGTRWSVQAVVVSQSRRDAIRRAIERTLDDLVCQLSHWDRRSALCRYNEAPAGSWQPLPADFAAVLDAALDIARHSDGALDPTLGPLVDLWGFGPPGPRNSVPDAESIAAARARTGWQRVQHDHRGLLQPGGVQLDLSAIAKGHAVDCIADQLDAAGLVHHLVEIGGELRGQGVKPDGMPWWVDIEAGDDAGVPCRVALDGLAIATSGDAIRHFEQAGQRFSHSLDPRSGAPLVAAPAAVTVLHARCREADGWATAMTVLGPAAGLRLADRLGLAVRWQAVEGAVTCSRGWRALLAAGEADR